MTSYYTLVASFRSNPREAGSHLSAWLEQVYEHLESSLNVDDVSMIFNDTDLTFSVSLLVPAQDGDSPEGVVAKGMGILRTAFHACDAGTPGWPMLREPFFGVSVTAADVADDEDAAGSSDAIAEVHVPA